MRTQVGIVGAGPAGLFLAHLLHREGIDCVILESRSRDYVENRVRAGVLEQGTVDLMCELGAGERLKREGMPDKRLDIRFAGGTIHIDLPQLTPGRIVTVYGQQEVVKDLIASWLKRGGKLEFEAEAVGLEGLDGARPRIVFRRNGRGETLECEFIAGCDGFHGICRAAIPQHLLTVYDRIYPFGWLGIVAEARPIFEMTYANHEHGFALASRRGPHIARNYLQCAVDEDLSLWPDERIWKELHIRLKDEGVGQLGEGPILQKAVTPVRAYVAAPMQYGRLYLAGDAAHIVPPTGAKGLNLAVADVRVLARALADYFRTGSNKRLERYSEVCLRRVWKGVRYSNYLTTLLHRFEEHSPFERRLQYTELEYLLSSEAARKMVAENYVGLPFEGE
ncbi:MAG TPA: 4-hydroxybenzoate 3-monooxygenase [Xanthobacteraceae bacterium]|nr:4-hydroxybenzoate 3-monooxygenase [Xanthobacteraceae bacterium]